MNEGVDYVVDVDRTGLDQDLNPKIIIIDKDTGTDQSSSQWHEGLHQFLQLKHGCKLSLMSLKAVFISNVSYLKLYSNLYGLSGTLGSVEEKKLLVDLYGVDLIKIPTAKPKNFLEEKPIINGDKEQWMESIFNKVKRKTLTKRSVLIIGETVKDVDYIVKHMKTLAAEELTQKSKNNEILKNLLEPYVYKREHEEFVFGQGNEYLHSGKVIVATNLAGRGTDIKLTKELVDSGGLHVIVTFLPNNCRIEEQAYGRAARCGEEGSGRLIILANEEDGGVCNIFDLINARDVKELGRLNSVKKFYHERIVTEETCFKEFKNRYEELKNNFKTTISTKGIEKLCLDCFLDKWAFWLDANSQLIERQASDDKIRASLFENLRSFLEPITAKFGNYITSPSQRLKLGIHYAKTGKYQLANFQFKKIVNDHPDYSAEALYYMAFATIKLESTALLDTSQNKFEDLRSNLVRSRELFEERITDCSSDQAIVEAFKRKEHGSLIHIEAFSGQQKALCQIYNLFINSINDIIGHPVMHNAFVSYDIDELLSYDGFLALQNNSILTSLTVANTFEEESLRSIAVEYGLSLNSLRYLIHNLKNEHLNRESLVKIFQQNISLPSNEELWSLLKKKNVLCDETEFLIITKSKLESKYNDSVLNDASMIQKYTIDSNFLNLKASEILQYSMSLAPNDDRVLCHKSLYRYLNLSSTEIKYLEERKIISVNRKATINERLIVQKQHFEKFEYITLEDLTDYDICEVDGMTILETLRKNEILTETEIGRYCLNNDIDCESLPQCYQATVAAILNTAFAYQLAYRHLQKQFLNEANTNDQLRVFSNPHQELIYDLMDKGIIEHVSVDYAKLMQQKADGLRKIFKKHELDSLVQEKNAKLVERTLNQLCCGIKKLDTPDCSFTTLEDVLKTQQCTAMVEASWFSLNGMADLITLQEQTYSSKFWWNIALITGLAMAQIAIGAVVEIFTAGIGTYAASFCINEGVSDLFFVAGSLCSGHTSLASYWDHKKWSMVMSAVTCGVAAWWSRGTKLSRIGYKVVGPVRKEGGKHVASMVGGELIRTVGTERVVKETFKRVGGKLAEGIAYGLAQGAVDNVIMQQVNGLCTAMQKTVSSDVDELFTNHKLNDTVQDAFKQLGERDGRLLMDKITNDYFDQSSILSTITGHCTRLYGSVSRGIAECARKMSKGGGSSSAGEILAVIGEIQTLLKAVSVLKDLHGVRIASSNFLSAAEEAVREELNIRNGTTTQGETKMSEPHRIAELREVQMRQWKTTVTDQTNQAIAAHVIAPLLSYGASQLVGYAASTIKKRYRAHKEAGYRDEFETLKKDFDASITVKQAEAEEYESEQKKYHDALMKLLAKTRDARLFADIVRENVPMDMTCVNACASLLHNCLAKSTRGDGSFTGIKIIVEGADGSEHEYSSSDDPSVTVALRLDSNHFRLTDDDNNVESSKNNNCLFGALLTELPSLKSSFENGAAFREQLSDFIANDSELRYTIAKGWHDFSIQRGSYGGEMGRKGKAGCPVCGRNDVDHEHIQGQIRVVYIRELEQGTLPYHEASGDRDSVSVGNLQNDRRAETAFNELSEQLTQMYEDYDEMQNDKNGAKRARRAGWTPAVPREADGSIKTEMMIGAMEATLEDGTVIRMTASSGQIIHSRRTVDLRIGPESEDGWMRQIRINSNVGYEYQNVQVHTSGNLQAEILNLITGEPTGQYYDRTCAEQKLILQLQRRMQEIHKKTGKWPGLKKGKAPRLKATWYSKPGARTKNRSHSTTKAVCPCHSCKGVLQAAFGSNNNQTQKKPSDNSSWDEFNKRSKPPPKPKRF